MFRDYLCQCDWVLAYILTLWWI